MVTIPFARCLESSTWLGRFQWSLIHEGFGRSELHRLPLTQQAVMAHKGVRHCFRASYRSMGKEGRSFVGSVTPPRGAKLRVSTRLGAHWRLSSTGGATERVRASIAGGR